MCCCSVEQRKKKFTRDSQGEMHYATSGPALVAIVMSVLSRIFTTHAHSVVVRVTGDQVSRSISYARRRSICRSRNVLAGRAIVAVGVALALSCAVFRLSFCVPRSAVVHLCVLVCRTNRELLIYVPVRASVSDNVFCSKSR